MNKFFNLATNLVLIKDLSAAIDFDLLREEFDKLEFKRNKFNDISIDQQLFNRANFEPIKGVLEEECSNYLKNAYGAEHFEKIKISKGVSYKSTYLIFILFFTRKFYKYNY